MVTTCANGISSKDNREFWEELKAELCLCLVAEFNKRHVESFLYLYRTLELVSIALPLVYASSEPDYKKSMMFLKSLSSNDRDSDLTVFRQFVSNAEKLGGYQSLMIDFSYRTSDAEWIDEVVRQFNAYIFSDKSIKSNIMEGGVGFQVAFSSMPLFIIAVRNRLFHNSKTGDNFRLDYIGGASGLCRILVQPALYWFSLVLIEIIKVHAKRYV
jgi:hypothetical protein